MIAVSSSGKSFGAIARYLAAGQSGDEPERVAWASARNVPTNDPELAGRFMRATAAQNARVEKPVYHLAIAFDPGDRVDRATMERVADRVLERLGLSQHEAVIVAHRDRDHPHMHLLVNRVHPETGKVWDRWQDRLAIQQVLREEERALGLRVVPGRLYELPGDALDRGDAPMGPDRPALTSGERRQRDRSGEPAFVERARERLTAYRESPSWSALESELAANGLRFERRGQGLIITDGEHQVKASRVARELAMGQLELRFGVPFDLHRARAVVGPAQPLVMAVTGPDVAAPRAATGPLLGVGLVPDSPLAPADQTPFRLATITEKLDTYDQVVALFGEHYAATNTLNAARARVAHLEAAVLRAHVANESFDRGLVSVYRDPASARGVFEAAARRDGISSAIQALRDRPEAFGPLVGVEQRRTFGLVRTVDDNQARRAALSVAMQGREAWFASRGVPTPPDIVSARKAVPRAETKERELRESLRRHPEKGLLEREIGRAVRRLLPHEVEELRRFVTSPQFAVAMRLRAAVREAVLGQEQGG